ncbi:uncharacterized protein RSE6_14654 [Rhynchosporium secalis]|uniref:Uncharacterized protein n=1 Tax=Rhynchosporium secalis TaxID=38038 RepID=A0A1E1MVS3_RHYSE|nr:uncharacterized protein RSE6_14654 [Rhynchosporium secalis]
MAVPKEITPPNSPPAIGALVAPTPQRHRPGLLRLQSEAEKFPAFLPAPKETQGKSKSLTEAEIQSDLLSSNQVAAIASQLQNEASHLSLQEARQRRESIKNERKKSIEFIRRRTLSRAGAAGNGRPDLEALLKPKFDTVIEGEKKD